MIDISIIIPHYNSWDYLVELLETIPLKDEIEIIVVDDNSPDQEEKLKFMSKKYPHALFVKNNSSNKGAGAARNIGIEISNGRWILFADSDDLFDKDFFKKIEKYINTNYDIVYFSPYSININGENSKRHVMYKEYVNNYVKESNDFNKLKLKYYFVVPWSKLINRKVIIENKIEFEEIMYSNDILFSAKTGYYSNKIKADNNTIYIVRESEKSLTSNTDYKKFTIRFDAWRNYILFLRNNLKKEEVKILNLSAMTQLVQIKQKKLGIKELIYVLKNCLIYQIPIIDKRIIDINYVKKYLMNK